MRDDRALRQPSLECIIGLATSGGDIGEVLRASVTRFEPCRGHVARRALSPDFPDGVFAMA